jgi:hypothetical protein
MLIACPQCQISFSPKFSVCPECKTYKARLEDRLAYLENEAEIALDDGKSRDDVEAMLVAAGIAPVSVAEIVRARSRKVSNAARSYATQRLICGVALLAIGIGLTAFNFKVEPHHHILLLGLSAIGVALRLFVLAGRALISGRD